MNTSRWRLPIDLAMGLQEVVQLANRFTRPFEGELILPCVFRQSRSTAVLAMGR